MLNKQQINDIIGLLKTVGQFQKQEHRSFTINDIEEKSLNQLVSYVDIQSEKMLVEGLKRITPTAGFIAEENTVDNIDSPLQWIIDPLDGTTNFLFHHYQYAISIALMNNDKAVFGGIYLPADEELYWATPDGAFFNYDKLRLEDRYPLENTLLATGFPYYDFKEIDQYLEILKVLMQRTKGLRRMGSAAIDLVYTADNRFNAFFEMNLSPWDVAAGAYIVEQAGGMVCDFNGGDNYIFGRSIIAGNKKIVPELLEIIQTAMKK